MSSSSRRSNDSSGGFWKNENTCESLYQPFCGPWCVETRPCFQNRIRNFLFCPVGLLSKWPLLGLFLLSGRTSCRKILWRLEAVRPFQSLWNLTSTSVAAFSRCLSNYKATQSLQHPISRLRDLTRFGGKTSYRLVNRSPGEIVEVPLQS